MNILWNDIVFHDIAFCLQAKKIQLICSRPKALLPFCKCAIERHHSSFMQTAHILRLTTLEAIQVGQSAVSRLERVQQRPRDASLFNKWNMWEYLCQHNDKAFMCKDNMKTNGMLMFKRQWLLSFSLSSYSKMMFKMSNTALSLSSGIACNWYILYRSCTAIMSWAKPLLIILLLPLPFLQQLTVVPHT